MCVWRGGLVDQYLVLMQVLYIIIQTCMKPVWWPGVYTVIAGCVCVGELWLAGSDNRLISSNC